MGIIIVNDELDTLLNSLSCIMNAMFLRISETQIGQADLLVLQTASVCFHQDCISFYFFFFFILEREQA